ncbi:MAG: LamG-like jellyroll fold domain-containing protein [archaeon]
MNRELMKYMIVLILVVGGVLVFFGDFTGYTFIEPNTIEFDINNSWNLSNGFTRVSQGIDIFDNDIIIVENKSVVDLTSYNLTNGTIYVDLVIDEMVVDSEIVNYGSNETTPPKIVEEPVNETIVDTEPVNETIPEEPLIILDEIIETLDGTNAPTHTQPLLNASSNNNLTTDNLTVYNQSTADLDGDSVKNIYNWYMNGSSITVLNMPFEGGSLNGSGVADGAKDYSGYNNNGTINGPVWLRDGGYDGFGAYKFNGIDEEIDIPYDSSFDFNKTGEFTVMAWIKTDTLVNDNGDIVNHYIITNNNRSWSLQIRTNVARFVACENGSLVSCQYATGTTSIGSNSPWIHLTGKWDGSNIYVYVNGESDDATPPALTSLYPIDSSRSLEIGFDRVSDDFNGSIDQVMIFNRSLSDEQIRLMYQNRTDMIHSAETKLNENWTSIITPNDGWVDGTSLISNSLVITGAANNVPRVSSILLNSTSSRNNTNGSLQVSWVFSDDDGGDSEMDNETQWYQRMTNGSVIKNTTFTNLTFISAGNLTPTETLNFSVRVYDGTDWSAWSSNASIYITKYNNLSNVSLGIYPSPLNINQNIYGYCNFTDIDGDYEGLGKYRWWKNGTTLLEERDLSQLFLMHFDLEGSAYNNTVDNESAVNVTGLTNFVGKYDRDAFVTTGDRLQFRSAGNINKSSGTILFWLQPNWNDTDEINERPFIEDSNGDFYIYFEPVSDQIKVNITVNTTYILTTNTSALSGVLNDNEWIHVAIMWNLSTDLVQVYLNNTLYANNTEDVDWNTSYPNIGTNIDIGQTNTGSRSINSHLDEYAIYDKPLLRKHLSDFINRSFPIMNNEIFLDSINIQDGDNITFECVPYDDIEYGLGINYTVTIPSNTISNTYANLAKSIIAGDGVVEFVANFSSNYGIEAIWLEINESGTTTATNEREFGYLIDDLSYFDWANDFRTNESDDVNIVETTSGYILYAGNISYNFTTPNTDYVYVRRYIDSINLSDYFQLHYYMKADTANVVQTRINVYNTSSDGTMTSCDYPNYPNIGTTGWQKVTLNISSFNKTDCDLGSISLIKLTVNDITDTDTFSGSFLIDEIYLTNGSNKPTDGQIKFNYKPLTDLSSNENVTLRIFARDVTGYNTSTVWYNLTVDGDVPNLLNFTYSNDYGYSYNTIILNGTFNDTTTPDYFWFEVEIDGARHNTSSRPIGYYLDTFDDPNWLYASGLVKGTNVSVERVESGFIDKGMNISYNYPDSEATDYFFLEHKMNPMVVADYDELKFQIKSDNLKYHQMRMDLWCEDEKAPEEYRVVARQHLARTTDWEEVDFKEAEFFVDSPTCSINSTNITTMKLQFGDYNNSDSGGGNLTIDEMYFIKRDKPISNIGQVPFIFEWVNHNESGNFSFRIWFNDSTGHENKSNWINITQKTFSSATGIIAVDNGSILDEISNWKDNTIQTNYTSPSYEEKLKFKNITLDLLDGIKNNNINESKLNDVAGQLDSFGYELVNYSDNVTGYNYYIIRENSISKGWGGFVFNPHTYSNLILESPHPIWDTNSSIVSSIIFTEMFPKALVVSTSYRYANPNDISDAGHSEDMLFAAVHDALIENTTDSIVMQIHGYSASGLNDSTWQVIISDGVGLEKTQEMNDLVNNLSNAQYKTCVWNYNCSFYSATNEASAHDTKRSGGQFIHVELNTSIRVYDNERENITRILTDFREWLPPNVTLVSPSDTATFNTSNITFECNATDAKNVTKITLYINSSTGFDSNSSSIMNTNITNVSFVEYLPAGSYTWNCLGRDLSGNVNFASSNFTFTINGSAVTETTTPETTTGSSSSSGTESRDISENKTEKEEFIEEEEKEIKEDESIVEEIIEEEIEEEGRILENYYSQIGAGVIVIFLIVILLFLVIILIKRLKNRKKSDSLHRKLVLYLKKRKRNKRKVKRKISY